MAVRTGFALITGGYIVVLSIYLLLRIFVGDGVWWVAFLNAIAHLLFLPLMVLFPLAVLIDRRSMLRLTPMMFIAGFWFVPYYLPKPSTAQASPSTLRVLTFNVWGDNARMGEVENWIHGANADVVLLQEIPNQNSENGFPNLLDQYPYQLVQPLDMRAWGNALLSRLPLQESESFDLEGDDTPSHQRVTIEWDGQTIAIYNVHLVIPIGDQAHLTLPIDNPFLNLALRYDDTFRNGEIRRLLDRIDAESYPFILGGDFNMSDQSVIYQQFALRLGDSFREIGSGFGGSWPLPVAGEFPAFIPPRLRMDYVWHTAEFLAIDAQQGPPLGSDHLPLLATLAMRPLQ
jgi:endonuclease/exonuclease/phosphatase (EEP) superfamily protein YafD